MRDGRSSRSWRRLRNAASSSNVRVFFSTGEPSGELTATELAGAIAALRPGTQFEGIGGERMRAAGFRIVQDTRGWASMGLYEALRKIPKLVMIMLVTAARLRISPPDLIVLIDFGAFNVRLARQLRRTGYRGPIVYAFPPSAWTDRPGVAQKVAAVAVPLTPLAHQRDFYRSLDLPVEWFGHPLASTIVARAPRPHAPAAGGTVAMLPGSRAHEIAYHAPLLFAAARLLRATRPQLEIVVGSAGAAAERAIRAHAAPYGDLVVRYVDGARAALAVADAAWVASGTAVLESALVGVPTVALYVVSAAQARYGRRVYRGRYVTLPSLVLDREVVPEILQEAATPARLAAELDAILADPQPQLEGFAQVREALGPPDALAQWARFVCGLVEEPPRAS